MCFDVGDSKDLRTGSGPLMRRGWCHSSHWGWPGLGVPGESGEREEEGADAPPENILSVSGAPRFRFLFVLWGQLWLRVYLTGPRGTPTHSLIPESPSSLATPP